ncbi:TetR/AcrR family transcriptional regulator [Nocardia zapadnayensis]|uniref:TetR/AcrR family transcriptional regulator n=1 Tax=Nocardia rhamnosiphila TaxID=426716 RepID=UPI002246F63E|nr:TetR/AcrR family transcriptional regulator [Nocardia zapadnayensis]MCX0272198.1 TetR/AcrR family transcriptional regulator [Nocardia zapadnayensis]
MPRPRSSETRERIHAAALELFTARGIQETSLRQIAEKLGLTKPALYYHFSSREDLLRSLVQPLFDDAEAAITADEARAADGPVDARELLGRYFDVSYRHRAITALLLRDLAPLAELGFLDRVVDWRRRLTTLLVGPDAGLGDRARAIVALGGLGDCLVLLADTPVEELRVAALDAACAALDSRPPAADSATPTR